MPRPPSPRPKQYIKLRLSQEVYAELLLRAVDPTYLSGVGYGAQSAIVEAALREYFATHPLAPAAAATLKEALR